MQTLNHHVGYSRENECWFVRFYPYQTEQKAKDAINAFTSAVAPVDGLETVAWNCTYPTYGHFTLKEQEAKQAIEDGATVVELVTRSQAAAVIAAERSRADKAEADAEKYREYAAEKSNQVATLQKDNAALTARVNGFEGFLDDLAEILGCERDIGDVVNELDAINNRAEALETQLAAAKKALGPFAEIAGEPWADENGWTAAACQKDRIVDWFGPSAFLAARAALEAKP